MQGPLIFFQEPLFFQSYSKFLAVYFAPSGIKTKARRFFVPFPLRSMGAPPGPITGGPRPGPIYIASGF